MNKLNIASLKHYMFTKEHIMQLLENTQSSTFQIKETKPLTLPKQKMIHEGFLLPKQYDTLFWCYYIMIFGQFSYEMLGDNSFEEEKNIKIGLAELIKENKELLKKNKWKRGLIETELVIDNNISFQTFFYMCAVKKLNVIIQHKRCIYTCKNNSTNSFELIKWDKDKGYLIYSGEENDKKSIIDEYMASFLIIENINKPIGPISSYKSGVIKDMCSKLNISTLSADGKKLNKKILYNNIICNF